MIGIGVYVSSAYSLADLKDARLVLLVWLIAGLHAICGAFAYAAIAKRLPVSGGEFAILTRWVHPSIGFIAAWISIIAGFSAPIAASAKLLGIYLVRTIDDVTTAAGNSSNHSDLWIATSVILFATGLHWIGLGLSAKVNNSVVALKLAGLLLFILLGTRHVLLNGSDGFYVPETAFELTGTPQDVSMPTLFEALSASDVWIAMIGALFFTTLSYTGFNASIYLAGEYSHQPKSDQDAPEVSVTTLGSRESGQQNLGSKQLIGRSMVAACLGVTVLYLALNFVFLYSATGSQIVESGESFVLMVSGTIGGQNLQLAMAGIIMLSCLTSVLAMSITGPQVYIQLARDYMGVEAASQEIAVKRIALIVQALLTIAFVWLSPLRDLVTYLGLTLTACGALAVSSIWIAILKDRKNVTLRLQAWESCCVTVYVSGAVILLIAGSWLVPKQFLFCAATFGIGSLVYLAFHFRSSRSTKKSSQRTREP